jgi:hypothetical protein
VDFLRPGRERSDVMSGQLPAIGFVVRTLVLRSQGFAFLTTNHFDDGRSTGHDMTSPPVAAALVPNAKIRKPSFLILIAALISRSCLRYLSTPNHRVI